MQIVDDEDDSLVKIKNRSQSALISRHTLHKQRGLIVDRNQDELSAEEVDRELKKVQLQREKLLLKKEMARQERMAKATEVFGSSGNVLFAVLASLLGRLLRLFRFVRQHAFKIILFVALFFGGIYGIFLSEEPRIRAFKENRIANMTEKCGQEVKSCDFVRDPKERWECIKNQKAQAVCYDSTFDEFTEKNKPFLLFGSIGYY